jgi:rRNA maturation endonuclease Nob1
MKRREEIKRNPVLRELAKPMWRNRIVQSKKAYVRKVRQNARSNADG